MRTKVNLRVFSLIKAVNLCVLVLCAISVRASEVELPKIFVEGEVAYAADMNANFEAIKEAVDDNNSQINSSGGGPKGDKGDKGDTGAQGPQGLVAIGTTSSTALAGNTTTISAAQAEALSCLAKIDTTNLETKWCEDEAPFYGDHCEIILDDPLWYVKHDNWMRESILSIITCASGL